MTTLSASLLTLLSQALTDTLAGAVQLPIEPALFTIIWVSALCGGLGGLVYELIALHGAIERPHKPSTDEFSTPLPHATVPHVFDLGWIARVVVGAAAAVAIQFIVRPQSLMPLIAVSLIAGSAGVSIFRSLQDRLLALVAETKLDLALLQQAQAAAYVEEAVQRMQKTRELQPEIGGTSSTGTTINLEGVEAALYRASGVLTAGGTVHTTVSP